MSFSTVFQTALQSLACKFTETIEIPKDIEPTASVQRGNLDLFFFNHSLSVTM